jgi:hypothetical protein
VSILNDTTRCHPRSMRQAYPGEYSAIEHYPRQGHRLVDRATLWVCALGFVAAVLSALFVGPA